MFATNSCAIFQGQAIKCKGIQKYIGRLEEPKRSQRRHSSFWIGLYGQSWVIGMEFFQEIVNELMLLRRNKLPFFSEGVKGYVLDFINLLTGLSPRQELFGERLAQFFNLNCIGRQRIISNNIRV